MAEINLPPFYVGQKVVALKDSERRGMGIKRGSVYVIKDLKKCNCGKWSVNIGIDMKTHGRCYCSECNGTIDYGVLWARASLFAPIQENFQSITLSEVLKEETKLISVN